MSEIETLTDEERAYLQLDGLDATPTAKALRIIDAHAADRAALQARVEAAEDQWNAALAECSRLRADRAALEAQLDAMTRDRDVWRRRSHAGEGPELEQAQRDLAAVRAERERLLDALADVDPPSKELFQRAERAEAQVAALTRERDEARADYKQAAEAYKQACAELNDTEAEVAHLQSALAAAERTSSFEGGVRDRRRAEAAEARVRELEARIEEARAAMTLAFGPFLVNWPQGARDAAEALRG